MWKSMAVDVLLRGGHQHSLRNRKTNATAVQTHAWQTQTNLHLYTHLQRETLYHQWYLPCTEKDVEKYIYIYDVAMCGMIPCYMFYCIFRFLRRWRFPRDGGTLVLWRLFGETHLGVGCWYGLNSSSPIDQQHRCYYGLISPQQLQQRRVSLP